jgi:hypothetical protein
MNVENIAITINNSDDDDDDDDEDNDEMFWGVLLPYSPFTAY